MKKILAVLAVVAVPSVAFAGDFRCPNSGKIVSDGMSQYEVEARCGAPSARTQLDTQEVRNQPQGSGAVVTRQAEEWTYDFGSNNLTRRLRFEDGILKSTTTGSYGYKSPNAQNSDQKQAKK